MERRVDARGTWIWVDARNGHLERVRASRADGWALGHPLGSAASAIGGLFPKTPTLQVRSGQPELEPEPMQRLNPAPDRGPGRKPRRFGQGSGQLRVLRALAPYVWPSDRRDLQATVVLSLVLM